MDPKKTRVLWKGLFGKNKSLKQSRNRAEKQLTESVEETSAFSKSSRKARLKAEEESAEALRSQQEAEQEQELQKPVRKYFNLNERMRVPSFHNFFEHPRCLKITQNVSFEFWQFSPILFY